jgi:hypothetical protein
MGRIFVRRCIWNGEDVSVKTKRGYRAVNIEPALVQMLAAHLGDRKGWKSLSDLHWYTVLQKQRAAQAESNSQEIESGASRAARFPAWPRLRAARERSAGRSSKTMGRTFQPRMTSQYTHFRDEFRKRVASNVGLFARPGLAENCQLVPIVPISRMLQRRKAQRKLLTQ